MDGRLHIVLIGQLESDMSNSIELYAKYITNSSKSNLASSILKTSVKIYKDDMGYIIDPIDVKFKCGWGNTHNEAIKHCAERNSIELQ